MKFIILVFSACVCSALHVIDNPGETTLKEVQTENGPVTLVVGKSRGRSVKFDVPKPFEVKSGLINVNEDDDTDEESRAPRNLVLVSTEDDDIPVIDGIRMPDDETDVLTYRNARIIKNVLVPYEEDLLSGDADSSLEDDNDITSSRQARILTGPEDTETKSEPTKNTVSVGRSETAPVYYKPYGPARVGLFSPEEHKEKIVTYSYNTAAGGALRRSSSKDVVYGQGGGAVPPNPEKMTAKKIKGIKTYSAYGNPQLSLIRPQRQTQQASESALSFQPSQAATGFLPNASPYGSGSETNRRVSGQSTQQSSNTGFKFPEEAKSFQSIVPVPQQQQQPNYQAQASSQQNFFQQRQQEIQQHQQHIQQHQQHIQQHQQHRPSSHFEVHSDNLPQQQNNQFQHQNPHASYPTPQEVLGPHNPIISNSQVIPVDPNNFVIEDASFQTHPGAPIFNIPVPRPAHQSQGGRFHNQGQNRFQQQNVYGQQPDYQYQYLVEDNRPLIEKMLDPIRRVGYRFRQFASPVVDPVVNAGNRISNRFRIPERIDKIASGNVGADAIPVFAGAAAVATLGALGAYAASRFNTDFLTLPSAGKRSQDKTSIPDVLLELARGLEDEDPSIVSKLTTDASWLESGCARKIFCSLVTDTMDEEEKKLPSGRSAKTVFERDILHLEKQMKTLIERDGVTGTKKDNLQKAADEVLDGVRKRDCRALTCSQKKVQKTE